MSEDHLYYKFRAIDKHLIESLVKRNLYFATPDTLNDPFDCQLDLDKSFKRAALSAKGERKDFLEKVLEKTTFAEDWKMLFEKIGICSFSLDQNETLLWSHYADEHKGLCLLYRFPKNFLEDSKEIRAEKVRYEHDALTDWLKTAAPLDMNSIVEGLVNTYVTSKSPAWDFEKEVRIIRSEHGPFHIPFGYLEQVCFGLRTPQADIDLITKLAKEYSGCIKFRKMIHDEESDFGMRAVEI